MTKDEAIAILKRPFEGKSVSLQEITKLIKFIYNTTDIVEQLQAENAELKAELSKVNDFLDKLPCDIDELLED